MTEVERWLEDAQRRLNVARLLLETAPFYDRVAADAYYAMYYAVRALLGTRGMRPKTHSGAASMLYHHFVQTGLVSPEQDQNFVSAQSARRRADYEHDRPTRERAARLLARSERFVEAAKQLI